MKKNGLTKAVKKNKKMSQQLTVRQEELSNQIAKAGNRSGLGFAKDAASFKKVRDLKPQEISDGLAVIFVQATNFLGIKEAISPNNKQDIKNMILTEFKSLSIEEMHKAFQMDRYGTFGDPVKHFQLFNSEYVAKVFNRYREWLRKTRFDNNIPINDSFNIVEENELTQAEKDEIVIGGVMRVYQEFKKTGVVPTGSKFVYDWLDSKGVLNYTGKQKQGFLNQANQIIGKSLDNAKSREEKRELRSLLEQKNSTKAIVIAKRLALKDFFSKNNMEEIINQIKQKDND